MRATHIRAVAAAALILASSLVISDGPVSSEAPPNGYMEAPPSIYTPVDTDALFAGPDPYIGYNRQLIIEGADPSANCDHGTSATDGVFGQTGGPSADCATVQFNIFGTVAEVNAALSTLSYSPDAGYESTTGTDGPDTLALSIIDGPDLTMTIPEPPVPTRRRSIQT